MQKEIKLCLECEKPIRGRKDKKFCDNTCRNTFNNEKNSELNSHIKETNLVLKRNRKILLDFMEIREGKYKPHKDELLKKGFNFSFITEVLNTKNGNLYHFCYEVGYRLLDKGYYLIVKKSEDRV